MDHIIDVPKIRPDVLTALRQRGHDDSTIAAMSTESALNEFCCHHGFRGNWGMALASVLDNLRVASSVREIHPRIYRDLRNSGYSDAAIAEMKDEQAFTVFCCHNGFTGDWGTVLAGVLDNLRAARRSVVRK